ncbi:MAG: hypothetical protein KDN22_13310 [Verrucomicrobiae bacterium]|nr:hypothetical protein [Verrucomicrobiae bacterium]
MLTVSKGRLLLLAVTAIASLHAQEPVANGRRPAGDDEMRYWLENMVTYHGYAVDEVRSATGMSTEEIEAALEKFGIQRAEAPSQPSTALRMLPYPGGRHPRIGFLEGAIDPQRETKVSVFTPWDPKSYAVLDLPEAIWSNLGLTYLAHTHIPTIWDERKESLEIQEWERREDGSLFSERKLPNGIAFGTHVVPKSDHLELKMWLKNGTSVELTDLRVQNCVMLKAVEGFADQSNDNKLLRQPFVAARNEAGDRWIITAWEPCHRAWANPPVPCLHSDPKFPDCPPGETRTLHGWFSFYQGTGIDAELARIAKDWEAQLRSLQH